MYESFSACLCTVYEQCPQTTEEGTGAPGTGTPTQEICKSSQCLTSEPSLQPHYRSEIRDVQSQLWWKSLSGHALSSPWSFLSHLSPCALFSLPSLLPSSHLPCSLKISHNVGMVLQPLEDGLLHTCPSAEQRLTICSLLYQHHL